MSQEDNLTDCPICGTSVKPKGMGSHKGSNKCKSIRDKKEIDERKLRTVPNNNSTAAEFLSDNGYVVEHLYYGRSGTPSKRYFTTQEGLSAIRDELFLSAGRKGLRLNITEKKDIGEDQILVCELTDDHPDYSDAIVVEKETDVDLARKRVLYIRRRDGQAFTTRGFRVGPIHTAKAALSEWDVSADIISVTV